RSRFGRWPISPAPAPARHARAVARRLKWLRSAERSTRPQAPEAPIGLCCDVELAPRPCVSFASASAHARPVAIEPLGLEVVEVVLKAPLGIHAEIAQERPGIDAGRVHVVEPDSDGIIADRIDGKNG